MEECYKHLDVEARDVCFACKRPICEACRHEYGDKIFCSTNCINGHKNKRRCQTISGMTSFKMGVAYWGFFFLAIYLIWIVIKFQDGNLAFRDLMPHIAVYVAFGLIMGIVMVIISFLNSRK